jgi:hypothetical protein
MNNNTNVREEVVARSIENLEKELDAIDLNKVLTWQEVKAIAEGFSRITRCRGY